LRRADRVLAGAALVAVALVAAKLLWLPRNVYPDRERLAATIERRLGTAGLASSRPWPAAPFRIRAAGRGCTMIVQQLDVEAAEKSIFAARAARIGPVRYLYGGAVRADFPRAATVLRDQMQRQAARLGVPIAIDPIIGVAATPGCPDPVGLFAALSLHPRAGAPALR
jgi:hypothetical protein